MGWFDELKFRLGIGREATPQAQTDAGRALQDKIRGYEPGEVRDLHSRDVEARVGRLLNDLLALQRFVESGQDGRILNVSIPASAADDVANAVIPLGEATVRQWAKRLEAVHGEEGGAFISELARERGHPYRGRAPRPQNSGLPTDAAITAARAAEAAKAREEAERQEQARLAERVQQAVTGAPTAEDLIVLEKDAEGEVVGALVRTDWDGPDANVLLEELLDSAKAIKRLQLGLWEPEENFYGAAIERISSEVRPSLESLEIGSYTQDETEISWTTVGCLEPLYAALPKLKRLKARGGGIELGALEHETLEELVLESGGLPEEPILSLGAMRCPRLRHLEIWFGANDYGAEGTPENVAPLLARTDLSALRVLGLMNAEFSDAAVEILASSPLAAQLTGLDLSLGTLSPKGAAVLVEHAAKFTSLEWIDVSENFLDEASLEALEGAFGTVRNSGQDVVDEYDGTEYFYVSVGE